MSVDDEHSSNNGAQPFRTLRDLLHPSRHTSPSCFIFPLNERNFDVKPGTIQLLPKFHGLESESAYSHLKDFSDIASTVRSNGVSSNTINLRLFPFSLKDKAKSWLHSLRPRTIGTWEEMEREFLKKFFPTH